MLKGDGGVDKVDAYIEEELSNKRKIMAWAIASIKCSTRARAAP
jgi:hypothetical protein